MSSPVLAGRVRLLQQSKDEATSPDSNSINTIKEPDYGPTAPPSDKNLQLYFVSAVHSCPSSKSICRYLQIIITSTTSPNVQLHMVQFTSLTVSGSSTENRVAPPPAHPG
ncbi:hypothetical protein MHYP_G00047420 [Metynnis hypsauchen]